MTNDIPIPFRWNVARRESLGSLIHGRIAATYTGFEGDLLVAASRVIAFSNDSDLYFVGRSLESMFDLLSGLLVDTTWAPRLTLLPFSTRWYEFEDLEREHAQELNYLRAYFEQVGLDPASLMHRDRPAALVDVVVSGRTLGNLVQILHTWPLNDGGNRKGTVHRLRLVGVTKRTKTSPNTWRWQQHVSWISLLEPGAFKSVSVSERLFRYLADDQLKVTGSFTPARWGKEDASFHRRDETALQALRLAVRLFDTGRQPAARASFAQQLTREPAMTQRWFRSLVLELRR